MRRPVFEVVTRDVPNGRVFDVVMNSSESDEAWPVVGGFGTRRDAGIAATDIWVRIIAAQRLEGRSPEGVFAEALAAIKSGKPS